MASGRIPLGNIQNIQQASDIRETQLSIINWLWQTYTPGEKEIVSLPDIVDAYCRLPVDKENFPTENELGRLLKRIFPGVKKIQKSVQEGETKKKCWFYSNLAKYHSKTNLSWGNLTETYSPPKPATSSMHWIQNKCCSDFVQWMIIPSTCTCAGKRLIREIRLYKTGVYEFYVMSKKVNSVSFGPGHGVAILTLTKEFLDNLFEFCAAVPLCRGFEVAVEKNTHDRNGNIVGYCQRWEFNNSENEKTTSLRHSSENCSMILNATGHSEICTNCAKIKLNSFYKTLKPDVMNSLDKKRKRETFMNTDELKHKLHEEQKKRIKTERREKYAKDKVLSEMKVFHAGDHSDFKSVFDSIDENSLNPDMKLFWEVQRDILETVNPKGYRWHPKIIRLCLSIWSRSPDVYMQLKESGMLKLPSGRLLSMYKNSVSQKPGLNDDVLQWMLHEAEKLKLDKFGREGGLILDEMAIQEDLQLKTTDGVSTLVGLVDLGDDKEIMDSLNTAGAKKAELASHVLQFVFLGNTGFRFPFAHWPTKEVDASTLYIMFWKAVLWLLKGGIKIRYCCCDGGEANRSFFKIHFKNKDPVDEMFTVINPYTKEPMIFIMDYAHNIKKLRNNVSKSTPKGTRNLTFGQQPIAWKQWVDAYHWDQKTNSLPFHHRLTVNHFELGYATKMRNHLAEQVLNRDMFNLMKAFQKNLSKQAGTPVHDFDKAIEFLQVTSNLVENLSSHQPYTSMADNRFEENDKSLKWFQNWEEEVKSKTEIRATERNKLFISKKTMFDVSSCIIGFREFCKFSFKAHPGCSVYAYRLNSNIVENIFCQQRGRNGQNDNPTYSQYGPTMNSILLGQSTTTKKSNTGNVECLSFYKPNKLPVRRRNSKT